MLIKCTFSSVYVILPFVLFIFNLLGRCLYSPVLSDSSICIEKDFPYCRPKSTGTETIDRLRRTTHSPDSPFLIDMTFAENRKRYVFFFVSGHCTSHDSTSFSLGFLLKPAVQVSVSTQTPWKCRRRTITGKRVRRITYWVCLSKVIEFLTLFYPWSGLGLLTYSCS